MWEKTEITGFVYDSINFIHAVAKLPQEKKKKFQTKCAVIDLCHIHITVALVWFPGSLELYNNENPELSITAWFHYCKILIFITLYRFGYPKLYRISNDTFLYEIK